MLFSAALPYMLAQGKRQKLSRNQGIKSISIPFNSESTAAVFKFRDITGG
jgi:hypothetical protein